MKYVVTGMNVTRKSFDLDSNLEGYETKINSDGTLFYRDEVIDTETNELFKDCESVWEVEDVYESFWNRINYDSYDSVMSDGYVNVGIVKVLNVTPFDSNQESKEVSKEVSNIVTLDLLKIVTSQGKISFSTKHNPELVDKWLLDKEGYHFEDDVDDWDEYEQEVSIDYTDVDKGKGDDDCPHDEEIQKWIDGQK